MFRQYKAKKREMKEYKVENHVSSYLPKDKKWKLVWSDEFDGDTLDESKWSFRKYFWGRRSRTFTDKGVTLDGKLIGRQGMPDCPVSEVEQFILVSTECHGYNRVFANESHSASLWGEVSDTWNGEPVPSLYKAVLPDEFVVDYVRVFDEIK